LCNVLVKVSIVCEESVCILAPVGWNNVAMKKEDVRRDERVKEG